MPTPRLPAPAANPPFGASDAGQSRIPTVCYPPLVGRKLTEILILKTGALGDVLRTTSILPGLHRRHPGCAVTWLTAPGARELVAHHPGVQRVVCADPAGTDFADDAAAALGDTAWDRVLSFDDELALCELATRLADPRRRPGVLTGAFRDASGRATYTPDAAGWFDMGLLSVHGKQRADRLKVENRRSHPEIFAAMLGIEPGEPELPLPESVRNRAKELLARLGADARAPLIGLNTGAGGRWESKKLPTGRVVELVEELERRLGGRAGFLLLGGAEEAGRNARILRELGPRPHVHDAGVDHELLEFAALVDRLDLLVTSDSLALHVALARRVPTVAFFAPTSAAEIDFFGRGEAVVSTAPDSCSYRSDADTSTLTAGRLADAVLRNLPAEGA